MLAAVSVLMLQLSWLLRTLFNGVLLSRFEQRPARPELFFYNQQHQRTAAHSRAVVARLSEANTHKMAVHAMKWSIAFVVTLLFILQLVYCSPHVNHDDDGGDSDDDDSRHGAVPRYSSAGHRQSRYRTSGMGSSRTILDLEDSSRTKFCGLGLGHGLDDARP